LVQVQNGETERDLDLSEFKLKKVEVLRKKRRKEEDSRFLPERVIAVSCRTSDICFFKSFLLGSLFPTCLHRLSLDQ
jgi:hypothetical protein